MRKKYALPTILLSSHFLFDSSTPSAHSRPLRTILNLNFKSRINKRPLTLLRTLIWWYIHPERLVSSCRAWHLSSTPCPLIWHSLLVSKLYDMHWGSSWHTLIHSYQLPTCTILNCVPFRYLSTIVKEEKATEILNKQAQTNAKTPHIFINNSCSFLCTFSWVLFLYFHNRSLTNGFSFQNVLSFFEFRTRSFLFPDKVFSTKIKNK